MTWILVTITLTAMTMTILTITPTAIPTTRPSRAAEERRTIEVRRAILEKNDRLAERHRGFFRARGLLVLNILSSPGSGKTTLIDQTIRLLGNRLKTGVIVGDLATDNDARRLRSSGAPVVQINTGSICHLDSQMIGGALKQLTLPASNSSSSRTSATSSVPPATIWAKTSASCSCPSPTAKTSP